MTHRTPESLFVALMMCAASCGVALAGGENVEVATSGLRVWVTGPGVVELDLGTGRVLQRLTVPAAPFPLGVTIVGDEAWVASASDRIEREPL